MSIHLGYRLTEHLLCAGNCSKSWDIAVNKTDKVPRLPDSLKAVRSLQYVMYNMKHMTCRGKEHEGN